MLYNKRGFEQLVNTLLIYVHTNICDIYPMAA